MGNVTQLSPEEIKKEKEFLSILEEYPKFLLPEIFRELNDEELVQEGIKENLKLIDLYQTPYGNFESYKVPFPLDEEDEKERIFEELDNIIITPELTKRLKEKINKIKKAIKTGHRDDTKPLDPIRRKYFEESVIEFNLEDYPEDIPENITEAACNIFGHICPVFFVGESITETSEKRRKGRYISFNTKMRVVRRDNYTCQECTMHLKDDEVEFDHIIPVSK